MGGSGNVPNFNAWLGTAWGAGAEYWNGGTSQALVLGLARSTNPPYYLDDFLANYPQFFGLPTELANAATVVGSMQITLPSTNGLKRGQFVQALTLPAGTLISSVDTATQITVTNAATATSADVVLTVFLASLIPINIVQLYLNLAVVSLPKSGMWEDMWEAAVGFFIAHYVTLYLKSTISELETVWQTTTHGETPSGALPGTVFTLSVAPPTDTLQALYKSGAFLTPGTDYTLTGAVITLTELTDVALYATWYERASVPTVMTPTAARVAARGIAEGILVSKSVGDASASYQALEDMTGWSAWRLTWFGQQLVTWAKTVGQNPLLVW